MKKKLQLFGIGFVLFVVFSVGLKGTFDGYYGFYYKSGEYQKPLAYELSDKVVQFIPVSAFIAYTGFDTGYGFFAPNVASDFVLMFDVQDSTGRVIEQHVMPKFKQKESVVRFTSVFNMFLEKIAKEHGEQSNQYLEYLDVVIRQIALSVKSDCPGAVRVAAKLYLYDYPTLEHFRQGDRKEKAILISEYNI